MSPLVRTLLATGVAQFLAALISDNRNSVQALRLRGVGDCHCAEDGLCPGYTAAVIDAEAAWEVAKTALSECEDGKKKLDELREKHPELLWGEAPPHDCSAFEEAVSKAADEYATAYEWWEQFHCMETTYLNNKYDNKDYREECRKIGEEIMRNGVPW